MVQRRTVLKFLPGHSVCEEITLEIFPKVCGFLISVCLGIFSNHVDRSRTNSATFRTRRIPFAQLAL